MSSCFSCKYFEGIGLLRVHGICTRTNRYVKNGVLHYCLSYEPREEKK